MVDYLVSAQEILSHHFTTTAEWRRDKAKQFPDDVRNLQAAEILETLAATSPTDNDLSRRAHETFESDDVNIHELLSDCLREVGFHSHPKDADDFLRILMDGHAGMLAAA